MRSRKYYVGEANITHERYLFNQRMQQPGECFDNFLADLRKLVHTCQFGELKDSLICNRIIIGIRDKPNRRRLLQVKKLALSNAVDMCVYGDVYALTLTLRRSRSKSTWQNSASKREPSVGRRCCYCYRTHSGLKESCPAYRQRCHKLNHFKKVCQLAGNAIRDAPWNSYG